jgi:hypothetical protein
MAVGISSFFEKGLRRPLAVAAAAFAAILLVGLSAGTLLLWSEVRDLKREDAQISAMLQAQLEWAEREDRSLQNLRDLAYTAAIPGISTIMLEGAEASPKSRGIFIISPKATWAMLAAVDLQPLPEDKAYQLWLTADGARESGGMFTVNETGYAQLMVRGKGLITRFQIIRVSVEPAEGSVVPTGAHVLNGVITSTGSP